MSMSVPERVMEAYWVGASYARFNGVVGSRTARMCVCRGRYRHARRAWSTVFGSEPKCFSLMLCLGANAGVMVDCMAWVSSKILAPLTSSGSCRGVRCTGLGLGLGASCGGWMSGWGAGGDMH